MYHFEEIEQLDLVTRIVGFRVDISIYFLEFDIIIKMNICYKGL
jgi:hypothetical protein